LVIVDLSLRRGHGIDLIKQIKARDTRAKTLVVSTYDESLYAERCLRAGAMGYINKQECRENIIGAIRQVLDGKRYVSLEMAERLIGKAVGENDTSSESPLDVLSDRELEIFHLIGRGLTTSEIAKELHLSTHTIDSHREKMKAKLNLKKGAELARLAVQWLLQQE
jgi:DNA-binding NarL/FixJ family response regulator